MNKKIASEIAFGIILLIIIIIGWIFWLQNKKEMQGATQEVQQKIQTQQSQPIAEGKKQSNNINNDINKNAVVSGKKYLITANIKIGTVGGDNKEQSFSILDSNGVLIKRLNVPSDLITGTANNVKPLGGNIYYMSGDKTVTSIGVINSQTGESKVLDFTKTNNTNLGNTLYAIIDWTVSGDNSKIAWMNTSGQINVANIDGSGMHTYSSGISDPINNKIGFIGNSLYFDTDEAIKRIDLNTGYINTVLDNVLSNAFAISDSGKYIALDDLKRGSFIIKDTESNSEDAISNLKSVIRIAFSPDESKITLSQWSGPGSITQLITFDTKSGKKLYDTINNLSIIDYISDTRILVQLEKGGLEIINLDGSKATKLNNAEYFEGILISDKTIS